MSRDNGILAYVVRDWHESYALLPCRTINKKWVWLDTIYKRRVWRWSGMSDEPYTEYATLLEVLADDEKAAEEIVI